MDFVSIVVYGVHNRHYKPSEVYRQVEQLTQDFHKRVG